MLDLPILSAEGISLRKLVREDASSLQYHADNALVHRNMFDGFPHPYTLNDALAWCCEGAHTQQMGYVWGIEYETQIIGCIGLVPESGWLRCNAEIGYWIGQAYWGRGITTKALALVMLWAESSQSEITRFYAPIFSWNDGSQGVVRKNGFHKEAVWKKSAIKSGEVIDRVVWAKYR
jgi:[ribosomal protein S5]-alanine N-acetyltransferase